jgi:hypothetical protein
MRLFYKPRIAVKEQDERGEKEIIAQKARDAREIEAVIGLHQNSVPVPIIAKSLNLSEAQVLQTIDNQANKWKSPNFAWLPTAR